MRFPALRTLEVNGYPISYDEHGEAKHPTVVLLSGWCQDHRLFDPLVPLLTTDHHVLRVDWRGHGEDRSPIPDFGPDEQAADTLAVLDALGVDRFLPVSTSHGGWANLEIAERAGAPRVPDVIVIDWLQTPASPEFLADLAASRSEHWRAAQRALFDIWLAGSRNELVRNHLDKEMAEFDHDMWARSCDVIAAAYDRWDSPLQRMLALSGEHTVRHLFSQPTARDYLAAQSDFGDSHRWYSHKLLGGDTHFPTLDSPDLVAAEIRAATSARM
ncbi:alpha/beta hydrolase family protein [Nocardia nova SH22a]|uniref:Alpha/beta hydrolase family protein n=1 Tax=Nocardia nova SH22a TaxID=1415166 RepID=W5TNN6_9NOCA|nr:alpha/beta hydrolase [Nocardia nova]AHH20970.1 alpha/beta hydrolase family protein [Nocardia nova SH22a]